MAPDHQGHAHRRPASRWSCGRASAGITGTPVRGVRGAVGSRAWQVAHLEVDALDEGGAAVRHLQAQVAQPQQRVPAGHAVLHDAGPASAVAGRLRCRRGCAWLGIPLPAPVRVQSRISQGAVTYQVPAAGRACTSSFSCVAGWRRRLSDRTLMASGALHDAQQLTHALQLMQRDG